MRRTSIERQPALGSAGLLLVVPTALLLGIGAGGAEPSLLVLAPLVTFALPVVAMIAFWWENWPGTRLGPDWAGWVNTLLVLAAAIPLTMLGQAVVGGVDLRGVLDPDAGAAHDPTFPATMPVAGAAFIAMLQLTLVCDRWPLGRMRPVAGGFAALALSWAVALLLYPADVDGGLLVLIGAWQVWWFVACRGWPFTRVPHRALRLALANLVVIGGGALTYLGVHELGAGTPALNAAAGSFIAAALVIAMLFDAPARVATLVGTVVLAVALYLLLGAYADGLAWGRGERDDWIGHAGLNAIGAGVILHVGIGRRWPFARRAGAP